MIIETSRFGQLDVDDRRFIVFKQGILGFPEQKRYALVQTGSNSGFYWLQAVDRPDLAFIVCDPRLFVTDYRAPIKAEELVSIGLDSPDDAQVFVIVNKVDDMLTGNLQGPLVINVQVRTGRQLVLSDRRYSTRHPLMRLPKSEAVCQSA
jgi:flagellar assembly factor FliW